MGRATLWCILRTASRNTMPLAKALTEKGIDAWSPVEIQKRRRPRSKDIYDKSVPIMPSYVFADHNHAAELLKMAMTPMQTFLRWDAEQRRMVSQGIPQFSVFMHNGRIPLIADSNLERLRDIERRTAPKPKAHEFAPGDSVKVPEGGFAGMIGVVQSARGDFAMVSFPDYPIAIKIARLLLLPDAVNVADIAAEAA